MTAPKRRSLAPPEWAERALPSLRSRFYALLALVGVLALAPWLATEGVHRRADGFASAIQEQGALRYRLLQLEIEVERARTDPALRVATDALFEEQTAALLRASTPAAKNPGGCPNDTTCARFARHLQYWKLELAPKLRAALEASAPSPALHPDVMLEVSELDLSVRLAARAVQEQAEQDRSIGVWASAASMLIVLLVVAGVWQVFVRIQRLSDLLRAHDERGLASEARGADEIGSLAEALGAGLALERDRRESEARRTEELVTQQLATRNTAEALGAWIRGESSLAAALTELARASSYERAEWSLVRRSVAGASVKPLGFGETQLGQLELSGVPSEGGDENEVLLDTLSQVFAIACLAERLLQHKSAQGRIATALGALPARPDGAALDDALNALIRHDVAVLELIDGSARVEDVWAISAGRLEHLGAVCDGPAPARARAVRSGENDGCPALRQRCPGPQLALPLSVDEKLVGALYFGRREGEFSREELRTAEALSPVVASAVARIQLEARLRIAEQWSGFGAFGRLLAHEIKNPLNSLGLELSLLERRIGKLELSAESRQRLQSSVSVVRNELARLTALTNDYLSLGPKSETLERQPVDLAEIAREVLRTHEAAMEARHICWVDELGAGGAFVLGHAGKLKQLMHNLIGNAIEAMVNVDDRVATLTLRRRNAEWELSVRDSGPGVSDPVAIFRPGFSTKPSGTGMGLAISQQIARLHDGRLLARTLAGGGAEFTLTIAAHEPAAGHDALPPCA